MTPPSQLVALLAIATLFACTPVCDEPGLRRAAEAFTDPHHRRDGLGALQAACPTLPPALAASLRADASLREATEDPGWPLLLARTCPEATRAKGRPLTLEDLEHESRTLCGLDRYGLLAADAVYTRDDLPAFMLFEWLTGGRVDRTLASLVALPLLTAHAYAAMGVTPPRGKIDVTPHGDGPELRLTLTEMAVDGAPLFPLERGRHAIRDFPGHVSPALRAALEAAGRRRREQAERDGRPWDDKIRVLADRATPFATLADALYTASKAGFRSFELVEHDGRELRGQHFGVPLAWFAPDDYKRERALDFRFVLRPDSVTVQLAGGGVYRLEDRAGIRDHVHKVKQLYPNEVVSSFRVDGDVPLQAVVSLLDTVSGETCRLSRALKGEKVPDDCLFWQPILDLEPPLDVDSDKDPAPPASGH